MFSLKYSLALAKYFIYIAHRSLKSPKTFVVTVGKYYFYVLRSFFHI